jgi:hypothetical protein
MKLWMTMAGVCLGLVLLPGCAWMALLDNPNTTIPAEYDLDGRSVLVVPMAEKDGQYFASDLGNTMAALLAAGLQNGMPQQGHKVTVLMTAKLVERVKSGVIRPDDWETMAEVTGADRIVFARILEFRLKEPGMVNGFLGTAKLDISVYDVKKHEVVYNKIKTHKYPKSALTDVPEMDMNVTEAEFREKTINYVTRVVGWYFYDRTVRKGTAYDWEAAEQK